MSSTGVGKEQSLPRASSTNLNYSEKIPGASAAKTSPSAVDYSALLNSTDSTRSETDDESSNGKSNGASTSSPPVVISDTLSDSSETVTTEKPQNGEVATTSSVTPSDLDNGQPGESDQVDHQLAKESAKDGDDNKYDNSK